MTGTTGCVRVGSQPETGLEVPVGALRVLVRKLSVPIICSGMTSVFLSLDALPIRGKPFLPLCTNKVKCLYRLNSGRLCPNKFLIWQSWVHGGRILRHFGT